VLHSIPHRAGHAFPDSARMRQLLMASPMTCSNWKTRYRGSWPGDLADKQAGRFGTLCSTSSHLSVMPVWKHVSGRQLSAMAHNRYVNHVAALFFPLPYLLP
jgi:hypothetical protein